MARRRPATTHGVCVVDKPAGVTSHDVVGMLRRRFDERQVGHGGTLDPDATGVLVVAIGMATRLLRFVEATTKRYTGEIVLGSATSTLDSSGEVTGTWDMSGVSVDDARAVVAEHLLGDIEQVPPMVSALKVKGVRLHELARQGIEVERAARPVHISRFDVAPGTRPGVLAIDVECSPGTYIRTLADDLGRLLGGGAHLRNLRRVAVGAMTIEQAAPPDTARLLPADTAVAGLARVDVGEPVAALIAQGRVLDANEHGFTAAGPWAVYGPAGLLAVYESFREGTVKPAVVLPK
jgi:tRNA pseudouridine55 synthase